MLADDVLARLEQAVPGLAGRARTVLDLEELIRRKALPQSPVSAFAVPAGLRARNRGSAAAGAFLQEIDEVIAVVLVLNHAADLDGAKTAPRLDQLLRQVVLAVCGTAPDDAAGDDDGFGPIGVFALSRGALVRLDAGVTIYQLEFSIPLQMRVFG